MLVVIKSLESHHAKERHQQKLAEIAQHIITFHELNNGHWDKNMLKSYLKGHRIKSYRLKLHPLRIYDNNRRIIFDNLSSQSHPKHQKLSFPISSGNQLDYQIVSFFGPPPKFILYALKKINALQCIFIFFASGLVSLFLSWSFTKPLKNLGKYSRRYAEGKADATISKPLIKRGDEIGDLARDIDFMRNKVDQNMQNQKQLLHDVSHELRAPLARLQAVTGILEQTFPSEDALLEKLHRECDNIDELIQQILNYSRLEQETPEIEPVNLTFLIQSEIDNFKLEFPKRTFNVDTKDSGHAIHGNYELISRALGNVLRNACKYSPGNTPIDIRLSDEKGFSEISVRDYGPGVNESELQKITTPFFRSKNKAHNDGYGLGLSIAARALDKLGGELVLQNANNSGFIVKLRFKKTSTI